MTQPQSDQRTGYTVNVAQRIRDLLGDAPIANGDSLTYTWNSGYERLEHQLYGGGGLSYQGAYHPDDGACVGDGVCHYCGRTLHA